MIEDQTGLPEKGIIKLLHDHFSLVRTENGENV